MSTEARASLGLRVEPEGGTSCFASYPSCVVSGVYHSLLCRLRNVVGKQFARINPDHLAFSLGVK